MISSILQYFMYFLETVAFGALALGVAVVLGVWYWLHKF